jgi:hypothetical protein
MYCMGKNAAELALRNVRPIQGGAAGDKLKARWDERNNQAISLLVDISNVTQNDDMLLYSDVIQATEHRSEWMTAGRGELISIVRDNDVWVATDLPKGKKALTTKWVFKRKRIRGQPDKYKGRLCVRGFEQLLGVDYWETYAPTAKWVTLRLFLSICACLGLRTRQLDVKTAFIIRRSGGGDLHRVPQGREQTEPFWPPTRRSSKVRRPIFPPEEVSLRTKAGPAQLVYDAEGLYTRARVCPGKE